MLDTKKLNKQEKLFYSQIKQLKEKGIGYKLMAKLSGVSYAKINNFVNGRPARITSEDIAKLRPLLVTKEEVRIEGVSKDKYIDALEQTSEAHKLLIEVIKERDQLLKDIAELRDKLKS